jgi:hypothetical protein
VERPVLTCDGLGRVERRAYLNQLRHATPLTDEKIHLGVRLGTGEEIRAAATQLPKGQVLEQAPRSPVTLVRAVV